ncbi:MAG TPA: ABC transporter ATP-binding protein, partial [Bacilli bacterium]
IALVFQNPEFQFVTNTVADEIAYSLKWEKISKGHRAQRIADITAQFELEPFLGRHPYQLSMGQKRRLSVAISIIQGQKLLLLDEPTFGLDARSTFAMLEQLEQLRAQGTTILMVTHDANIVNHFSSRVWLIHEGRLVKDSKEEVMTTCS